MKSGLAVILFFLTTHAALSQNFQQELESIARNSSSLKNASWGLALIDVNSGRVMARQGAGSMLATASTMKAVTAITAFERLGSEYRFTTRLGHDGIITGRTLTGNLYIVGDGDPSLGSDRFPDADFLEQWARMLKARGITHITGSVIADASGWDSQIAPDDWPWQDLGNYYAAGASALNYQENLYYLHLQAGAAVGQPVKVLRTTPELPKVTFHNELTTGPRGSGDRCYIYGPHYTYTRYLRGTIPLGARDFTVKGSLPNPPEQCAIAFWQALQQQGIQVAGGIRSIFSNGPSSLAILAEKKSPPLAEIIREMNLHSVNLFAECLLKKASGKRNTADASRWLRQYWQDKDIREGMRFTDGSGLSSSNAASPLALARILEYASKRPYATALMESLPLGGRRGTLSGRFRGTAGEGRIFAKTGTTGHVRSLAGYIKARSGKRYAFCFIVNHYSGSGSRAARTFDSWLANIAAR